MACRSVDQDADEGGLKTYEGVKELAHPRLSSSNPRLCLDQLCIHGHMEIRSAVSQDVSYEHFFIYNDILLKPLETYA